jgi:hypothetical protein
VAEARSYDVKAPPIEPRHTPVVHLVLETKAAALRRIVGTDLSIGLGLAFDSYRDSWNALQTFNNFFYLEGSDISHLRRTLCEMATCEVCALIHAQGGAATKLSAAGLPTPDEQIEKFTHEEEESRLSILQLVGWWSS